DPGRHCGELLSHPLGEKAPAAADLQKSIVRFRLEVAPHARQVSVDFDRLVEHCVLPGAVAHGHDAFLHRVAALTASPLAPICTADTFCMLAAVSPPAVCVDVTRASLAHGFARWRPRPELLRR